ncbi:MAG: hypothetical protein H5T59_00705 [Anaerolineae bacterium]|nr:hypothetical protein [Anaerolineae bacterium]
MKPSHALRLAAVVGLSLALAACAPSGGPVTARPTPPGPARPPTAHPTTPPPTATPTASAEPFVLVIMHTNDVRGYTEPCG